MARTENDAGGDGWAKICKVRWCFEKSQQGFIQPFSFPSTVNDRVSRVRQAAYRAHSQLTSHVSTRRRFVTSLRNLSRRLSQRCSTARRKQIILLHIRSTLPGNDVPHVQSAGTMSFTKSKLQYTTVPSKTVFFIVIFFLQSILYQSWELLSYLKPRSPVYFC